MFEERASVKLINPCKSNFGGAACLLLRRACPAFAFKDKNFVWEEEVKK